MGGIRKMLRKHLHTVAVFLTVGAFFLVWGLVFLARWSKTYSLAPAFLAGLCLGGIPSIRYPEALLGIGIGAFILVQVKGHRKARAGATADVIGAVIVNPMSITWLVHHDERLELVKWTRYIEPF